MDRFSSRKGGSGEGVGVMSTFMLPVFVAFVRVFDVSVRVRLGSKRMSRVRGGGSGGIEGFLRTLREVFR